MGAARPFVAVRPAAVTDYTDYSGQNTASDTVDTVRAVVRTARPRRQACVKWVVLG